MSACSLVIFGFFLLIQNCLASSSFSINPNSMGFLIFFSIFPCCTGQPVITHGKTHPAPASAQTSSEASKGSRSDNISHYSFSHSFKLIFRFRISSTSRIIIRSCGMEYSGLEVIARR